MSRIGRTPISIPSGVTVTVNGTVVETKGPKGALTINLHPQVVAEVVDTSLKVSRTNEERQTKALHGLYRSLLNNAVTGVHTGYKITLKLIGTGYRATAKGQGVSMSLGFSHPVVINPPAGVTLKVEGNDTIYIEGIDRQAVGQVAANIRRTKPPEPYKGKGIRYENEVVRRKQGKAAAK